LIHDIGADIYALPCCSHANKSSSHDEDRSNGHGVHGVLVFWLLFIGTVFLAEETYQNNETTVECKCKTKSVQNIETSKDAQQNPQ
jgi:hypothetical protein